ncbi:fungal-specific transcription factor domain-containing protein [Podospora fimiseda]|uniref:Fungal-specific transcription factor domain-containing protein n=1 Tax=Podospora fimiseda TaxID=252190 RepID=A0AAN7BZS6_9PEZI|nr:fungal-specific transcription factor domain-containing protein [Podospora fimiseda]
MSAPVAVQRMAPIAIAPKPPRFPPSRQGSITLDSFHSGLRSGFDSPDSGSVSGSHSTPPCEACLRRRSDCVVGEEDDHCVACQYSGTECSLGESPPIRKRKLNGDAEDRGSKRSSPGRSDNRRRKHQQQPSISAATTASSSLIEDMANFGGPTMLKRTLGLQADRYSQYIGPTTDFEPSLINLSSFDPQDESLLARGTLRRVSDNDTFLLLPDYNTPGYEQITDDVDEIEGIVAPHGRKLIDLYFRVVHPAFPIIQKTVFLEKYERSHREFAPPLLAAVYILAINWWNHDEDLANLPKPNVRELERLVRTTLADSMYRPKLSTIQAGLLLSQRPEGDQWAPTAQLVAIGQELGLHLDCSGWKIPPWERGLRKRLAWALYMQDKWGALVHGRPSHIFPSNWAVQPLNLNDFPDVEWDENNNEERIEIERGRVLFNQMVHLSQILAEILDTFYTLQATKQCAQGVQLVLTLAKPIQLKLKDWYAALPAIIRMDSTYQTPTQSTTPASQIGYLHLAYFATEITLHRKIVRSMDESDMSSHVQQICRSAAKARLISAMDFVNRLTPAHLKAFWYFASKTNFALIGTFGSLLWATSPGREEAEWYRRRLGEYRWTLSVSSKPGENRALTEFAMGMLDISTGLLKQLPEKPLLSRSGSVADVEGMRRGSMFALGGSGISAGGSSLSLASGMQSGFGSVQSPMSEEGGGGGSESSDEGIYGNFSMTSGIAGLRDR